MQVSHLICGIHIYGCWEAIYLNKRQGIQRREHTGFQPSIVPAGIKALEFLKQQVNAGIRPQINHFWGEEFADRKFAVMLEGSWLLSAFPHEQWTNLSQKIGFLPMFPVPDIGRKSATMLGGWILGIPETSQNRDQLGSYLQLW